MTMKSLVLAEKPSVGRELARVLGCKKRAEGYIEGDKYIVTWSLGHLITLADPEAYDERYKRWSLDYLPMLPKKMKLTIIKNTASQFRVVHALTKRKDVSELIIATDSGREGELVARWIMMKCAWKGKTRRLWISSQTDKAIKEGFANLKDAKEYDNLFKSAEARSHADWIVGINVTRALTCRFNTSLSAGRVQTPTLALIVERENAIKSFVSKEYFTVNAKTKDFVATYKDKKGIARIFDKQTAEDIAAKIRGKTGVISALTSQLKQTPPPAAYDLTALGCCSCNSSTGNNRAIDDDWLSAGRLCSHAMYGLSFTLALFNLVRTLERREEEYYNLGTHTYEKHQVGSLQVC